MWSLRFRPEIESDLREGHQWYASRDESLGDDFIRQFWHAIDRILDNPLHYAIAQQDLRPCRLKRFPYVVYYRVRQDEILVVAVLSGFRDESVLRNRQ